MDQLLRQKLLVTLALTPWVSAPYFALERFPLLPARAMPVTALDRAIPFDDRAVFVYLSLYLLLPIVLTLVTRAEQLRRATVGIAVIAAVSHLVFFLYPTYVPVERPGAATTNFVYGLMTGIDRPLNACPSLHASLAVFAALWCQRLLEEGRQSRLPSALVWLWTAAIFYSTLATRQHVVLDLAAGALLGGLAYFGGNLGDKLMEPNESSNYESPAQARTAAARAELSRALAERLPALRRFDLKTRLIEMAAFIALFVTGLAMTIGGINRSQSITRWLLIGFGVAMTAVAINSFVLLMHEAMHNTLFAGRQWNRWVAVALGATFLMSFSAYQVMHARHHDYLGDERDPDDYHNYSRNPRLVWALHFVRLTVGALLYIFLIPFLALKPGTSPQRRRILVEYALLFAIYLFVLAVVPGKVLFIAWFVPLLLVGWMTAIRGFTQHGITDASDPFIASRTIQAPAPIAFFLLNENYHLEHHLFPEIPSYHLRELHELIWPRLPYVVTGTSYLAFLARFFRATLRMDESPIGLTKIAP
jgi:fatty acid desaturase